jgi:glutamine amidotransferase
MTTNKVGIIDLNIGNVGSLINTIKNLNFECEIIQNPESIKKFKKLIIPGVGAYDVGMSNIIKKNWLKPIMNYVNLLYIIKDMLYYLCQQNYHFFVK